MTEFDINKLEGLHKKGLSQGKSLTERRVPGTMARFCVTGVRN